MSRLGSGRLQLVLHVLSVVALVVNVLWATGVLAVVGIGCGLVGLGMVVVRSWVARRWWS